MQGELTSRRFLSVVMALTVMWFAAVALGQSSGDQIQLDKLQLEKDKLAEQRIATFLTLGTIAVTALIGFGTIAYNIRNAKNQAKLQVRLKALEVVVSAVGPNTARERLKIVEQLLGKEFIEPSVGENLIAQGVGQGHDQNRKDLIKMLLEYPDQRTDVFALWGVAFGRTNLGKDITAIAKVLDDKAPNSVKPEKGSAESRAQDEIRTLRDTSFEAAETSFKKFLGDKGFGSEVHWVFREDVIIAAFGKVFVRTPIPEVNREQAKKCFDLGKKRNLGIAFRAIGILDEVAFAYILLPKDDLDAQYKLMGEDVLKPSCTMPMPKVRATSNSILWKMRQIVARLPRTVRWDEDVPSRDMLLED
jgi:hypothetical protein